MNCHQPLQEGPISLDSALGRRGRSLSSTVSCLHLLKTHLVIQFDDVPSVVFLFLH